MRACAALLMLALLAPAWAQQQPSREREALRRARQQLQQVREDNAALQRDKGELQAQLEAAQAELAKLKKLPASLKRSERSLAAAEQDKAQLQARLTAGTQRLEEIVQQCREQIGGLRAALAQTQASAEQREGDAVGERARLDSLLAGETQRARSCEASNAQLYRVTVDLIARYKENRGAWEKFLLSEPFTGLKSVEVDNLLEDMRARADRAKVKPVPESADAPLVAPRAGPEGQN